MATMNYTNTHTSMNEARENSKDELDTKVGNILGQFINGNPHQEPFKTNIREQPVTQERKPYAPKKADRLTNAGTARATIAASQERPNGTTEDNYAKDHQHQTV